MQKPAFWKTRLDEVDEVIKTVKKGKVRVVAKSPGGRNVYLVEYGEKEDFNRSATYSSACGAGDPKYYADKKGKKPVVFIIGAEHGSETEGSCAILNMIQMIETGKDFNGNTNPYLVDCIKDCRLLLIPIANPDGRSHMGVDTLHGIDYEEFRHYAQGRWKDGTLCYYPACKTVHPIKDAVSFLGGYFNDDGINLVHDNFFGKMAAETQAIMDIADAEAPDYALHLHGGGNVINEIDHASYMPLYAKQKVQDLKMRVKAETEKLGLRTLVNQIRNEDTYPPKTFNIMSALHFVCGAVSILYESNQGLDYSKHRELDTVWETIFSYEEILTLHYILFEQTIKAAHDDKKE